MIKKKIVGVFKRMPGFKNFFVIINNLANQISYLNVEIYALKKENDKLKNSLSCLKKENDKLKNSLSCLKKENDNLTHNINRLESNNILLRYDTNRLLNFVILNNSFFVSPTKLLSKGKIALYTTIIGEYDEPHIPISIENDLFDYYCITDNINIKSDFWNIIYFNKRDVDDLKNIEDDIKISRYIKTHPHIYFKKYKHSLYIDANVVLRDKMSEWISSYINGKDILVSAHPQRICIYEEAKTCISLNKDTKENVNNHINKYKSDNYPENNGLTMNNVLYRIHSEKVNELDKMWWEEILNNSKRDQMSFCYCVFKLKFPIAVSPLNAFSNKYYYTVKHN